METGIHSQHVFAIGDIHGHAAPLEEALETISRIPTDDLPRHLIFLGDTVDRGPANMETANLVEKAADIAKVDIVTRLIGNHEIMLYKALSNPDDDMMFWSIYGGCEIIREVDPDEKICCDSELAAHLKKILPAYLTSNPHLRENHKLIDDVLFVHAGVSPQIEINDFLQLSYEEELPGRLHWAWIRNPFLEWTGGWATDRPITITHGHSPATSGLYADTAEVETSSMLHHSHGRINLDAGAGYEISQIAMAEFFAGSYRVHIFQDETYSSRSDPSLSK